MQPSLVVLLVACVALAALGFFLGFVLHVRPLGWLSQATFVFMAALMVPLLVIVLWWQAGAAERLARTGVVPHPDARHAIGLAVGRGDASRQWLFALDAAAGTDLGFYERPEHREGWEILSHSDGMWILERGERRMVVTLAASSAGRSIGYAAVR